MGGPGIPAIHLGDPQVPSALPPSPLNVNLNFLRPLPLSLALTLSLLAGSSVACVERTLQIRSSPPGARAYLDDQEVGRTPITVPFDFYGTRRVRLTLDGHRPHEGDAPLPIPVYEWIPLDFVFENLVPFTLHDAHVYEATLVPLPTGEAAARETEAMLKRAEDARRTGDLPIPPRE